MPDAASSDWMRRIVEMLPTRWAMASSVSSLSNSAMAVRYPTWCCQTPSIETPMATASASRRAASKSACLASQRLRSTKLTSTPTHSQPMLAAVRALPSDVMIISSAETSCGATSSVTARSMRSSRSGAIGQLRSRASVQADASSSQPPTSHSVVPEAVDSAGISQRATSSPTAMVSHAGDRSESAAQVVEVVVSLVPDASGMSPPAVFG